MTEALIIGGLFAGCLMRALFPFLKKKAEAVKNNESIKWENRYIITILFALVTSIITTMYLLPTFSIPEGYIFPAAFIAGWGSQDIMNRIAK